MARQTLEIKYRCMHPSCCVNCREGLIGIDSELFNELSSQYEEEDLFKSPRGICRLGFSQPFKVLTKVTDAEAQEAKAQLSEEEDPIAILVAEHKKIISIMEGLEEELRKRDIDALWISTAALESEITLHSGRKEEDVLFPALSGSLVFGDALVSIVKEDHREIMSLLHNFRTALEDNNIMDGIIRSMIVSLKSHIRKEDYEFFELVNKALDDNIRKRVVEGFKKVEAEHVPIVPGERRKERTAEALERDRFDDDILAVKDLVNVSGGCCHG